MKTGRLIIIFAVCLSLFFMASVCASDVDGTNSTLDAVDEVVVSESNESDSYLSADSSNPIDDLKLSQNYGVEGTEVDITPTATANGVNIPGRVTFYSDSKYSNEIGSLSTEGGKLKLPMVNATGTYSYCPFYYIFDGEYNNVKYHDKDYLYFFIMEENTIDIMPEVTPNGLTIKFSAPTYYKFEGSNSLLSIYVNGEKRKTFDVGEFSYNMPYTGSYNLLDIYVAYEGYVNQTNAEYYAPCQSRHLSANLAAPKMEVVNSTYGNVQLKVYSPAAKSYNIYVISDYEALPDQSVSFDGPGEKTVTLVKNYPAGPREVWLSDFKDSSIDFDNIKFNIVKANPDITIKSVGGNNTVLTANHNIVLSAPGNGKFTTNVTSGEYSSSQTISLNNCLHIGRNVIAITYSGDNYYNSATKEIVFFVDKYQSQVRIGLNETVIVKGGSIKVTPTVTVNGKSCTNGTVAFYNQNDVEIGRIDLAVNNYFEYKNVNEAGSIYAIYLESPEAHQSPKSESREYSLKRDLAITLSLVNNPSSPILTKDFIEFNIVASELLYGKTFTLYDGNEVVLKLDSSQTGTHILPGSFNKGAHDFYIKFDGDGDYNPSESNHVECVAYEQLYVIPTITLNATQVVEGDKVLVTANASYYNSTSHQWVDVPGNVTVYDDGQVVTIITIGTPWVYYADDSSAISKTFTYRYDDYIDKDNFVAYSHFGDNYEFTITTKAIPTIIVVEVCGNETTLSDNHNITLSAQGSGKFTTNCSSGEYDVGQTIVLNNLHIGENRISIHYSGDEAYNATAMEIVFVVNKYPSNVTLELNQTIVAIGDKIKVTPTVTVNGAVQNEGTVVFYNGSDAEIGRIDLASDSYFEYVIVDAPGSIYAVYLETSISCQSNKSESKEYRLKLDLTIVLSLVNDSSSPILTNGSIEFNIAISEYSGYKTFTLYNGNEIVSQFSSSQTAYIAASDKFHKGPNDFFIRFDGDANYNPAESNHIYCTAYEPVNVVPSVNLNATHIMDGGKVMATANASYYNSTSKQWIVVPGTITVSSNGENVVDIVIGDSWIYAPTDSQYDSSSDAKRFTYRYNNCLDDVNFICYMHREGEYGFNITTMHENSMNFTIHGQNESLDVLRDDFMPLKVNLKYYLSNVTSGVMIYVDDEPYGEFNLTSEGEIEIGQISISTVGNHTVYAYYKGYLSQAGLSAAPVKSNVVNVNVVEPEDVDFRVVVSNDAPEYNQTITLNASVSHDDLEIMNGTVIYYIGENAISDELAVNETFSFTVNQSSEFNITARYSGYALYPHKVINVAIHAQKADNKVNLTIQNMTYGENVNISISNAVDGIYTVHIGDCKILVNVAGGVGSNTTVKLDMPAKDGYEANVTFDNINYNTSASAKFNIAKINSKVTITSCDSIDYGDDFNATFKIENMTQGVYEIRDANGTLIRNGSAESNNLSIKGLFVGKYTLTIKNIGDENHTSTNATDTFNVLRLGSHVEINMHNYAEFNYENVTISFTVLNPTYVTVIIQDSDLKEVYSETTNETFVYLELDGGSFGEIYSILVYNAGNETVYPSQDMRYFIVYCFDAEDSMIIPPEIHNNQSFDITVKLKNDTSGNMSVSVDGQQYNVTVSNGTAKIPIEGLSSGDKTLNYTYFGNDRYGRVNGTLKFTVLTDPKIVDNRDIQMIYSDGTKYTVRVYGENGKPVAGVYVTFDIDKQTVKVRTDANGYASLAITGAPKTYAVTATYKNAKVTNKVVVKHILKSKNKKVKKSARKLVLKASLKKVNGKYLKGKVIKFKFKGKTYKAKTNKKGVAKVTIKKKVIKKLKKGKKYNVKITYQKDSIVKKIKVKK